MLETRRQSRKDVQKWITIYKISLKKNLFFTDHRSQRSGLTTKKYKIICLSRARPIFKRELLCLLKSALLGQPSVHCPLSTVQCPLPASIHCLLTAWNARSFLHKKCLTATSAGVKKVHTIRYFLKKKRIFYSCWHLRKFTLICLNLMFG